MKRACARALLLLTCLGCLTVANAQVSGVSERLVFTFAPDGDLLIQVNAAEALSGAELRKAKDGLVRDGVALKVQGEAVSFSSPRRPLVFEAPGLNGFRGQVPAEAGAQVLLSKAQRSLQIEASHANRAALRIDFSDSGQVQIPAGGTGRAEFFSNGTYFFSGSTNVTGTTADGLAVQFGRGSGPMLGGPLVEKADARGTRRLSRSSPAATIEISGSPESEIRVQSAALADRLFGGQDRLLNFESGVQVMLRHEGSTLQWRVLRGVCQFRIAGFSCWKATATSGQSGSLQWSSERRVADLRLEPGEGGFATVQLSGRMSASVAPGATFQYAQFQDCGSFSTGALGDAALHDRESGETIPIRQSAISFNEGVRTGAENREGAGTWHPVSLSWDSDARVVLRGAGSTFPVNAGMEDTLRYAADELNVNYSTDGSLTLRATAGNFTLNPAFLPDIGIEIPEGGALALRLNRQRLLFTAQAAETSGANMRVTFGGQTYMYLSGEARITVVLGQNSLIPEGSPAWIFFEGAGGETLFTSGQQPGIPIGPSRLDVSRIPQEPVSVIE